jgi:hypothetical protein
VSEQDRDPELDELERRLNAAFATLRPRAGFAEELGGRLRAQRGWPARLREAWAGFGRAPLVPALGGIAALLIVALVAFALLRPPHPASSPTAQGAASKVVSGAGVRGFGTLPAPALRAGAEAQFASPPALIPYTGPATLHWSGVLPELPATAPVLRFQPSSEGESSFASASGATVDMSGPEPRYRIDAGTTPAAGTAPADDLARAAATAFLAAHNLTPAWPSETIVTRQPSGTAEVHVYRDFEVPGAAAAPEVDAYGTRTGTLVLVGPDQNVYHAEGPVPLPLQTASYALRQPQSMVAAAISSPAAGAEPAGASTPDVQLTQARLVYLAVAPVAGQAGYYEPALLFTGSFSVGNQVYEKRVLVSALDPSQLRS